MDVGALGYAEISTSVGYVVAGQLRSVPRHRAKAAAISSATIGRDTTSETPAATSASTSNASEGSAATKMGKRGVIACSAAGRRIVCVRGNVCPIKIASNLSGVERHAVIA